MAENTIDTLSIQITSSSQSAGKAIDKLITNLTKLNGALNNYDRETGQYGRALSNLEDSFNRLNTAISKINSSNLDKVSKSISSLANSAGKLNTAFGNTGMDKASADAMALDQAIDKAVQGIVSRFGTVKGATEDIRKDLANLASTARIDELGNVRIKKDAFNQYADTLKRTIGDNIREPLAEGGIKGYDHVLDYISGHKVSLPFQWQDVAGDYDEFKRKASTIFGVGNFDFGGKHQPFDSFVSEMDEKLKTAFSDPSVASSFETLYEYVSNARSGMDEFSETTMRTKLSMEELSAGVSEAFANIVNLKLALANDQGGETTNPFANLANGLRELQGLQIPDLTGVAALATNIGKLANKQANAGIQNLPALVNGLQSLNAIQGITIPDLTGLAELISVISTLGTKKSGAATMNLQPLITGLQQLSAMTGMQFPDGTGLITLANAFSAFGRETTGRAVQNIPQLANAFNQMIVTLSKAPKVSSNVIALANAMAKLSSQGAKVGSASRSMNSALNRISASCNQVGARMRGLVSRVIEFGKNLLLSGKHANSAGRSYQSLVSKLGLLYAKYWALMRVVSIFGKVINPASSLIEVQNVVDTTFGNMAKKVEDFSHNAIKSFGLSELSAKQTASRYQAMGTAMGITGQQVQKAQQFLNMRKTLEGNVVGYDKMSNSMADMSINLTKLSADMASFYDVEQSTVEKALASGVLAGQSRPLNLAA